MNENGFYLIKNEYIDLINQKIGGTYNDTKQRPIYCCIKDNFTEGLFWAVPTSELSHRSYEQIKKYKQYINLPHKDIRSCYYHIGHTSKPALFKISNVFPVIDKYIHREYTSNGKPLVLKNQKEIKAIRTKVLRIISYENLHINKFEQHITDIRNYLINELNQNIFPVLDKEPILPNEISDIGSQGFGGLS